MTRSDARKRLAAQRLADIHPAPRIKVGKSGLDWFMHCAHHDDLCWTADWAMAYEAAAGHAVMHHGRTTL